MISSTARFIDALERAYPADTQGMVERVLLIATEHAPPVLPHLLDFFPQAALTATGENTRHLDALRGSVTGQDARMTFIQGSIADLPDLAPGPYDLAVIRQPDISFARAAWRYALTACANALSSGGLFFLTTDLLPNAAFTDEAMTPLPVEMLPGSPYSAVPVALNGIDRYIMFYRHK